MNEKSMGLFVKMAAIMAGIGNVGKDAKMNAGQLQYTYVTDEKVYNLVRKLLIDHGVALMASMVDVQQERHLMGEDKYGNPKDKYHTIAKFEFTLVDSETGESMTGSWFAESDDNGDKGINKCATAALKYWLLKTFIIPTGDDPDEVPSGQYNATAPKAAPQPRPQPAPATPPATDEPEPPPSELDEHFGPKTWKTPVRINNLIVKAEKWWAENQAPTSHRAHTVNRLAQVLGLSIPSGDADALVMAIKDTYAGSDADAWKAVQLYEHDAPPAQPALPGTPAPKRNAGKTAAERSGIASGQ